MHVDLVAARRLARALVRDGVLGRYFGGGGGGGGGGEGEEDGEEEGEEGEEVHFLVLGWGAADCWLLGNIESAGWNESEDERSDDANG